MAFYCDYIFPVLNSRADPKVVKDKRSKLLACAQGRVLEIGFGTGKTLEHYPRNITELSIAEPSKGMSRAARKRIANAPFPVSLHTQSANRLTFDTAQFDTVVTTKTLCSVSHQSDVLSELRRVLRPTGKLLFLEHVRSSNPRIAVWQDRFNPLQRRIGCGCNLNRDTEAAIEAAGFRFDWIDRLNGGRDEPGVRFMPIIAGQASPADRLAA